MVPDFRPDSFFSPAARTLRNTCSYIRLNAMPPSGHPCRLLLFVRTTESSLSGIFFVHTSQVAVWMSLTRSLSCELAPVRLIKFLLVIASSIICSHTSSLVFNALSADRVTCGDEHARTTVSERATLTPHHRISTPTTRFPPSNSPLAVSFVLDLFP